MFDRRLPARGAPALALSAVMLVAACGVATPTPTPGPGVTAPAAPQVLVYANPTTFPDLDPSTGFSNDNVVVSNVYETLTRWDPGSDPQIQPLLATSWSASADGLTWTFNLRPGVTFHDGTPLNAAAVKYSIERTMSLGRGAAFIWDAVEAITVVDDLTVEFTLSYEAPLDLIASSGYGAWIMSPTATEGKDNAWFNAGNGSGTGPYMFYSYEKDQRVVLKRFDAYWGGWKPGQFDTVIFRVVGDAITRQKMVESGEADFTHAIPTENLPALRANPNVRVVTNPSYRNMLILLNTAKAPTNDVRVRQALSFAFPYQVAIDATMAGYATRSRGPVPAALLDGADRVPQYTHDLDRARALLADAGYADGGIALTLTITAGDTVAQQTAELYRAELAKIGVDLTVKALNWEAQWSLARGDPTQAQDMFMFYWWPTYPTPYDFLFNMFHSEDTPNFNLGYYKNPAFDALINEANTLLASDRAAAMRMFVEASTMIVDDAAAIFVNDQQNIHVVSASLKGFVDNPAYPHVLFVYDLSR
ncbi:MAG TPA: ABC transporter substrate-binding protein [Desulfobacterales bacterium]|nr:ABC transporter substrate-binding protein [Desulfobacterales bacterium]